MFEIHTTKYAPRTFDLRFESNKSSEYVAQLPREAKELLGDAIVITLSFNKQAAALYAKKDWETLNGLVNDLPPERQKMLCPIFSHAESIDLKIKKGIIIGKYLYRAASIEKDGLAKLRFDENGCSLCGAEMYRYLVENQENENE